jgi:hypothetical protein
LPNLPRKTFVKLRFGKGRVRSESNLLALRLLTLDLQQQQLIEVFGAQFETAFVTANLQLSDVEGKMNALRTIDGDIYGAFMAYLRQTHGYVEAVYKLDKEGGFEGSGTAASRAFTAGRLAAGASMLRDMIYAAWLRSAEPVPQWRPEN